MPVFWSDTEIREQLSQPQTVRVRHPYRGPRSSYRINLEISQLTYDIARLYARMNSMRSMFSDHVSVMVSGGDPTGPLVEASIAFSWSDIDHLTWAEMSEGTWSTAAAGSEVIPGMDSIAIQLQAMRERVAQLERTS